LSIGFAFCVDVRVSVGLLTIDLDMI